MSGGTSTIIIIDLDARSLQQLPLQSPWRCGWWGGSCGRWCSPWLYRYIVNSFNIGTSIPGWGISWSIWPDSYRWTQPIQRGGWVEVVHKVQPLLPVFFSRALALLGSTPEFGINDQILDLKTYGFWENFSPVCTPCWRAQIPQRGNWWGLNCMRSDLEIMVSDQWWSIDKMVNDEQQQFIGKIYLMWILVAALSAPTELPALIRPSYISDPIWKELSSESESLSI